MSPTFALRDRYYHNRRLLKVWSRLGLYSEKVLLEALEELMNRSFYP